MHAKEIWFLAGYPEGSGSSLVEKFNLKTNFAILIFCFLVTPALTATTHDSTQPPIKSSAADVVVNIKDDLRHESMKRVLAGIINLKKGKIGEIIQKFSRPDQKWVWKVKEGNLPTHTNAKTERTREGVLTTLDYGKLKRASTLSVARTIIHEMVHAYLVLYFQLDGLNANKEYPEIVRAWQVTPDPDLNSIHHAEMANSLVDDIALAVKEYGLSVGHYVEDSVCRELAWAGLDFQNNDQLAEENKMRIQQRLSAEQLGTSPFSIRLVKQQNM